MLLGCSADCRLSMASLLARLLQHQWGSMPEPSRLQNPSASNELQFVLCCQGLRANCPKDFLACQTFAARDSWRNRLAQDHWQCALARVHVECHGQCVGTCQQSALELWACASTDLKARANGLTGSCMWHLSRFCLDHLWVLLKLRTKFQS